MLLISEAARKKILESGNKIKIDLEPGGCSGFRYVFSNSSEDINTNSEDILFSYQDVKIFLSKSLVEHLSSNAILDYKTSLTEEGFCIKNNANAARVCGCGNSVDLL